MWRDIRSIPTKSRKLLDRPSYGGCKIRKPRFFLSPPPFLCVNGNECLERILAWRQDKIRINYLLWRWKCGRASPRSPQHSLRGLTPLPTFWVISAWGSAPPLSSLLAKDCLDSLRRQTTQLIPCAIGKAVLQLWERRGTSTESPRIWTQRGLPWNTVKMPRFWDKRRPVVRLWNFASRWSCQRKLDPEWAHVRKNRKVAVTLSHVPLRIVLTHSLTRFTFTRVIVTHLLEYPHTLTSLMCQLFQSASGRQVFMLSTPS